LIRTSSFNGVIAETLNGRPLTIQCRGNKTPKKGYKSITVKADVYNYFFRDWLKVKEEYTIKKGIRSFSAYVTYRLAKLINEETKQENNKTQ